MIETVLGQMDEAALECETVAFDGPEYYAYERRYREPGGEQVIARYHDVKWTKENDFLADPGTILTSRGDMPTSALVKSTGTNDEAREFNCWVEYRLAGEDEILHRSAHVKLKNPPTPAYGIAGRLS